VRPPSGAGPLHDLLGWRAPADWAAVGVVGQSEARGPGRADRGPVALLVTRAGVDVAFLRRDDGTTEELDPGRGRLLDACRRALGLATPPPAGTVAEMWEQRWLDRLVEALAGGEVDGADDAAALHPLAGLLGPGDDLASVAWSRLARASWADLRWLASGGGGAAGDGGDGGDGGDDEALSPELAAWMDDGMVQRWLTDGLPSRAELLEAVLELAPGPVLELVEEVLAAWAAAGRPDGPGW